jgi:hypothetical protein
MINGNNEAERGRPRKRLEDKLSDVLTTDRQKAFLKNRLAGLNKRQAAIQAGYAVSTASIMAKKLTDRLSCCQAFIEEMQRQGLTIEAIVGEIKRGMTEPVHPNHPDFPDNFNRRAYADMAIRLYGGYAPTKVNVKKDSREEYFRVDIETIRLAEEVSGEKILDDGVPPIIAPDKEDESPS